MAIFRRRRAADDTVAAEETATGDRPAGRRRLGRRDRDGVDDRPSAGERAAGAGSSFLVLLARVIMFIAIVIAVIIGLAILFVVLEANSSNEIVSRVNDWGKALVGPFDDIFEINDPKVAIAVNWGLALVVYLVVASFIARLLRRAAARA